MNSTQKKWSHPENRISAFIICKNEEAVIERALNSLLWADEIVVVDAESTDRTVDIARRYTDRVFVRRWTNFGDQRNFALSQTKYPWVFFLDADEICSSELVQWFQQFREKGQVGMAGTVSKSTSQHPKGSPELMRVDLYEIRRLEHFRGRQYRFGSNNPSYQWRFFRREETHFVGTIHEYPVVHGLIVRVENPILHFPKETLAQLIDKMNRYTALDAERLFKEKRAHGAPYMFFSGLAMFIKSYVRKQGFRDGLLGFILAVLDGSSFFLRQAKLYLIREAPKRNPDS